MKLISKSFTLAPGNIGKIEKPISTLIPIKFQILSTEYRVFAAVTTYNTPSVQIIKDDLSISSLNKGTTNSINLYYENEYVRVENLTSQRLRIVYNTYKL